MPSVMAALPNIGGASVQRRKVWLTPTTRVLCSNAAKPRNRLTLAGVPQANKRSQPLVCRSSPYWKNMWRRHCCLTGSFPIVDTCLNCEDIAWLSCAMVPRWRIFGDFWALHFQRSACSTFQTCILNSHWGHTMRRSIVDIPSVTAEIRRGIKKKNKEERRKKPQDRNIMSASATQGAIIVLNDECYGRIKSRNSKSKNRESNKYVY